MITTLTKQHWNHITHSLEFYIDAEEARLSTMNASATEWQRLEDVKGTLNDILLYVMPDYK